jgi:uncharacterized membrane protein YphA (DoxX/SURF4 family)
VNGSGRTGWAGGRPRGLLRGPAAVSPDQVASQDPVRSPGPPAASAEPGGGATTVRVAEALSGRLSEWAPVGGRALLGLVFLWFGFHELEHPGAWTGYVPVISETSNLAVVAVLIHGWVLFVLGFALIAGIQPRLAAALGSIIMLEIVISLVVTGLSDTALRDVGVLGLAVCLMGCRHERLILRG